jgi:hypothetical protein
MTTTLEATKMPKSAPKKRNRRSPNDLVAALEAKIQAIKRAKANPAVRYTVAAVRSMDKAMAATTDAVLRSTLDEARGALSAYLSLQGVAQSARTSRPVAGGRRSTADLEDMASSLIEYIKANPGQRGEQIAAALGTATKTMRRPMLALIEGGSVRTKGERRGMRYYPQ